MEYIEVEDAIDLPGLRLVLTAGVPGPWGEAAKGVLHVKGIEYTPVRQVAAAPNEALLDWTGRDNAPVAMYADERPRSGWAEILFLAERLAPSPSLVPSDPRERALMLGLCHEICGEQGLGWTRRLLMGIGDPGERGTLAWKYGGGETAAVETAVARVNELLELLEEQLRAQRAAGRRYFVGESLTAPDIYWAAFSNMVAPLPPELSPMPDFMRRIFTSFAAMPGAAAPGPLLIEHRDFVLERHLTLPQDF